MVRCSRKGPWWPKGDGRDRPFLMDHCPTGVGRLVHTHGDLAVYRARPRRGLFVRVHCSGPARWPTVTPPVRGPLLDHTPSCLVVAEPIKSLDFASVPPSVVVIWYFATRKGSTRYSYCNANLQVYSARSNSRNTLGPLRPTCPPWTIQNYVASTPRLKSYGYEGSSLHK